MTAPEGAAPEEVTAEPAASARQKVEDAGRSAKAAALKLAALNTQTKNDALLLMAEALIDEIDAIIAANGRDLRAAEEAGLSDSLLDRFTLTPARIAAMADGIRAVAALRDPIGRRILGLKRPNGLVVLQIRVPIGVVGIIYDGRPTVVAEAVSLCLKSGNAILLWGGANAFETNLVLTDVIVHAATRAGVPTGAVHSIATEDPAAGESMLHLTQFIDVLIPQGHAELVRTVVETATVPTIKTGVGNCHVYVHATAPLGMAVDIAFNAKVQRPGAGNSMETLLVDRAVAEEFLPLIAPRLVAAGVELRGCSVTRRILRGVRPASEQDWYRDYLAPILAVKVVAGLDEAVDHINKYGSRHSEAIVTTDYFAARRFGEGVDAAVVFVNASTRFTDGFEFGLGAEVGISTQKLHARGPMGLEALTTIKWVVEGEGQVRS
jgi:glutamate-5-semialdehyde dehydrogenase